jgi:hypothetical protein
MDYTIPPRRIALVIGNYVYTQVGCSSAAKSCKLNSPQLDATAVASVMRGLGYQVKLTLNASKSTMEDDIANFARWAPISTTSFFYYSGHGLQLDGDNYLIPVDATIEKPDDIAEHAVLVDSAFSPRASDDAVSVIALDACRDNPFLSAIRKSKPGKKVQLKEGLAPIGQKTSFLVSYATGANQIARDGAPHQMSPYARALVSHLTRSDTSIQSVFSQTQTSVCNITSAAAGPDPNAQYPGCQRPEIYTGLGAADVFFTDQPDVEQLKSKYPILTDIGTADPTDPAVKHVLGNENSQFGFGYIWDNPTKSGGTATITPDLEYLTTKKERGRPLLFAQHMGYYAPEEGGTAWTLSYPIIDIIGDDCLRSRLR